MSTLYEVRHRTAYAYSDRVSASYGLLHMLPRAIAGQHCERDRVLITPTPGTVRERPDAFGNRVLYFALHEPHRALEVTVTSQVTVEDRAASLSLFADCGWEQVVSHARSDRADPELCQYLLDSPLIAASAAHRDYAAPSFSRGAGVIESVTDLCHRIHADFAYAPGTTTVSTPLEEVFAARRGVCQDFAHVGIACLRAMGIPARYVSGYLETEPPPGRPKLTGVDGSHAWLSLWVPEAGWLALDPTNDGWASGRYITTAVGRDYSDVPPMQGVILTDGHTESLEVTVDVVALGRRERPEG